MRDLKSVKEHFAKLDRQDWNAYKADLAPDAVYEEVALHLRVKGADEYVKSVQRWYTAFPDLKATVLAAYVSGDITVVELEWAGTHTGPLDGPFGTIPPTNKRGTVKAALISRMKNDKIVEARHYFDILSVLMQMGVAPVAGATAPAAQPAQPARH